MNKLTSKKSKNPLYVVTNKGKTVEEATNFWDAVVKKWGLGPVIEVLSKLLEFLLGQVQNYAMFRAVQEFLDRFIAEFNKFKGRFQLYLEDLATL